MQYVTMSQVRELARQTGNTPQGVLTELFAQGYQIADEPAPVYTGKALTNSKDALAQWNASKATVAEKLYKNDPIVRQLMDTENAQQGFSVKPQASVVQRDDEGRITGTTKSMLTGATSREQAELMKAIRANYNKGE